MSEPHDKAAGAVDLDACPNRHQGYRRPHGCRCGLCAVCGYPKHSSVHGPIYGEPPGSKPWGHEYQPGVRDRESEAMTFKGDDDER